MNKLKRTILSVILSLGLVLNPSAFVLAGNDPGLDAPSAVESTPAPTPSPSSSPEANVVASPTPSPSPTSSFDGTSVASPDDKNGKTDYYLDDAEKERRWVEYQAWLASQITPTKENTGGTESGGNVGDTSIKTGDANAAGAVVTNANTTTVSTPSGSDCGACSSDTNVTNSGNGSNSNNTATANTNNTNTVVIENDANVANNLDFDANSGNNDSSGNVGNTEIISGDANVVVTLITNANNVGLDLFQFDVNENQIGDIVLDTSNLTAINSGNGSGSTNNSTINNTNTNIETIDNDGNIVNNIDIDATTGKNTASKNTGGDSTIETGDANVVANVVNALNTVVDGAMNVVNIFGDMVGNIVQPTVASDTSACGCSGTCTGDVTAANIGNGTNSENNTNVNNTNTNTTTMNNNAQVQNNLDLNGNTGGNTTSDNTDGFSSVETGDVNIDANVINIANINLANGSCDPIYFVFINDVSGGWEGQILGAAPGTYFYTSDGSIYFVDANGQLVAMNKNNGANSENNTTINNTNTNSTTINNNGTVTNNINIDANTGDNDASKNTGGNSSITTGDANIAVNVVNFINSNFSGRKVVMTLVNVFGSWMGNFVPAGYTGDIPNPNAHATGGSNSSSNSSSGGSSSVKSNGGGTNTVALGGQVLAAAAKGTFKTLIAGETVQNGDGGNGQQEETKVSQFRAGQPLEGTGIPVPIRFLLIMIPLGALTFVLRKKAAVVALKNK